MRALPGVLLISLLASGGVALGQDGPPAAAAAASPANPLSAHNKMVYAGIKGLLLGSAEKMAEENYGFRPIEGVRTFGQVIGHVADSQYTFCSRVLGEKNPAPAVEKTRTSKADLIVALKDAFAYCDKAYDGMTDEAATQTVKIMGGDTPKLSGLNINNLHTTEHYGNLVTYLRMKNLVPPSSEPGFLPQTKK